MRVGNFAFLEDNVADADWALLCRFDIRDEDGELYLRRWRIVQTPWFAVYVHKILQPDQGRDLHDHPWNFWSLVLKGGYKEVTRLYGPDQMDAGWPVEEYGTRSLAARQQWYHKAGSMYTRKCIDYHQIVEAEAPTWTLFVTGKRRRDWGFLKDNLVWVSHNDYEGVK